MELERIRDEDDRQNKRIALIEEDTKAIHRLTTSIEKLVIQMQDMLAEQKEQSKRIQRLEEEPGDAWLEHLCTHEFRHVVQFDKINQGLTHGLYYLFGEIFPIAVVGVYLPMWFLEGDAVCFETSVGHVGRGRSPEFLGEMKAQMVEKGIYSFPKAILGSQKDYVPNRYNMGYFMTANTRRHYGSDVWAKALERTGRRPFGITPFDKSLKLTMQGKRDSLWQEPGFRSLFANPDSVKADNRHSGAKHTLYYDNFTELRQRWLLEAAGRRNDFDTISTCNKYYAGYYYPTPLPDGGVLAYKEGLRETGAFVFLQGGRSGCSPAQAQWTTASSPPTATASSGANTARMCAGTRGEGCG